MFIYEIRAKGTCVSSRDKLEWLVDRYTDMVQAEKHYKLCVQFVSDAAEALPADLKANVREIAMSSLNSPYDRRCGNGLTVNVSYEYVSVQIGEEAPEPSDAGPWKALDTQAARLENLLDGVTHMFMRDEVQEGAPPGPLPMKEHAVNELWRIGIDHRLPALNALPDETGGDAYYRMLGVWVERARAEHSERCKRYHAST